MINLHGSAADLRLSQAEAQFYDDFGGFTAGYVHCLVRAAHINGNQVDNCLLWQQCLNS